MPDKKRILFVGDEPKILAGLCHMLCPMRREWEMSFAGGGQKALDRISSKSFDVLVTDLHMPGIDGVELLKDVR